MKRIIRNKVESLRKEWGKLKDLSMEENIGFDKAMELQEKEEKAYKKYLFYKNLLNAIERCEKHDR